VHSAGRRRKRRPHEGVLDLYAEAPDPSRPVVCFDESPIQLIGEVRAPIPRRQGQLERHDCEYKRNGTANLFVFLEVHRPLAQGQGHRQPHCARLRRVLQSGFETLGWAYSGGQL
jgi:hypothetical protein